MLIGAAVALLFHCANVLENRCMVPCSLLTGIHLVPQVMVAHREFLRRVLKGCLLSRRVKLLRALIDLKTLAQRFAAVSARIRAEAAPHGSSSSSPHLAAGAAPALYHSTQALMLCRDM